MNKKAKFIISTTTLVMFFSVLQLLNNSIMPNMVYGAVSTYLLADRGELKSLEVQSTEGKSLDICDDYDGYKKDLTDEKTYYVTLDSNIDGVRIVAQSAGDGYVTKIFESDNKYATPHNIGENISVREGSSTLYIRTFTSEEAFKRAVKDEEVTDCEKTYKININKASTNEEDKIYIDKLTVDSDYSQIPIGYNKDILLYNINVDKNVDEITIKAEPEDEDYTVKIDSLKTGEDRNYERTVQLKLGQNQIKVNITDDGDKTRTYTLNINRGSTLNSSKNTLDSSIKNDANSIKINQWVKVNDRWQYNDSVGIPLKNVWFYDKNSGKNYYLQADSNMATGWLLNNGNWYYLDQSGARQSGWYLINNQWYYFDTQGVMKTGWIRDMDGKYYYLQENGVMARDSMINGYKLGVDGAMIK
ncbi:N-acetylmuramoyl-L-alanine amidase family protein [Clostridium chromiireducens]|uniref:N-acetylmuramoyl-L-alanine amidase family protein n=1 Tax=Clostridium chromiireducens TaxID=225345 RepID=A0A399J156_9CLOT|nr:cadherin-like beta sandwich domain-containing protein [Clostridium chromiireducens]RII36666.1 N-acetylmuramoyl-L-alanine amidase family protein [Clostridium chromiireducens]